MSYRKLLGIAVLLSNYFLVYTRICENVHVALSNKNLESSLRGCTTVIGYVKITLFSLENITEIEFPELTTITGYLLVYQVSGLTSIGKLFPNLNIIGGDDLLMEYALIIYDLPHLKEIGLTNLRYIGRGAVRIDRCPRVCFVDTIDWSNIGGRLDYFNTNHGDCPWCLPQCKGACWNQETCQKRSVESCGVECLLCGDFKRCDLCKKFTQGGICVTRCPKDKFGHLSSHTCVTKEECVGIGKGKWFIFNDECIRVCPDSYKYVSREEGWCRYCGNNCTKICAGSHISDIQSADEYRHCTYIKGNLEIQVSALCTDEALTYGLGNIRIIDGYLKIVESHGLLSLNFLKELKSIRGNRLYQQRYSLVVLNNNKLRELWDSSDSKVTLERGIISFHYNPKLCLSEIDNLVKFSLLNRTITQYDVCPISNGDEVACTILDLNFKINLIYEDGATITWNKHVDAVEYIFYFKEDSYQNASTVTLQTECFDLTKKGWFLRYTTVNEITIMGLKPFTFYAFYVQICTLTSYFAGRTNIHRFRTRLGYPSPPIDVTVVHVGVNDVELFWMPPKYPGGIIKSYQVLEYLLNDNLGFTNDDDDEHFPCSTKVLDRIPLSTSPEKCCGSEKWITDIQQNPHVLKPSRGAWLELENTTSSHRFLNLKQYGMYALYLRVCNDLPSCSVSIVTFQRTKPSPNADDIYSDVTTKVVQNTVDVQWKSPKDPNSHITSYLVRYRNTDLEHSIATEECITIHDYAKYQGHIISNLSLGKYSITVTAISLYGPGNSTEPILFEITSTYNSQTVEVKAVYFIAVGFIVGIVFMVITYWHFRQPKPVEIPMDQTEQLNRIDLEFSKEERQIDAYGVIRNGFIKSQNRPCTVKFGPKYINRLQISEFVREVNRMKFARNAYHVASFIGLVFPNDPPLVIMELMAWGDLKSYLKKFKDQITELQGVRMAAEIADGMLYLSSQHLTHPDLATRNCMVTAGCTIKLVIFGINKDLYPDDYCNYKSKGSIPIRWMAPESIADGVINLNSNVWSYGVVLWEIVTGARQPYENLIDEEVARFVIGQRILERPAGCGNLLYHIMSNCWRWKSNYRTNFLSILEQLVPHVRQDFGLVSFYDSEDGVLYRTTFKDKLTIINKNLTVRWKTKDQVVTLDTIRESVQEDLNLPSTSTGIR